MELVHRPGEAHLVNKLFDLLGLNPKQLDADFEGTTYQYTEDMVLYCSEVLPEQWQFELWLQEQIKENGEKISEAFVETRNALPQKCGHFGIGIAKLEEWEALVGRLRDAEANDPELRGRISIPYISRPEDAHSVNARTDGALNPRLWQCFLRTDIFSAGLLTTGQAIEVQHMTAYDPDYADTDLPLSPIG